VVKPPVPVIDPLNCVVLVEARNWLVGPVNAMLLDKVMAVCVFNCATLPAALLLKLSDPFVLVKLAKVVISKRAVLEAVGERKILPPPDGPKAPAAVADKIPALMVVVPV